MLKYFTMRANIINLSQKFPIRIIKTGKIHRTDDKHTPASGSQ